MAIELDKLRKHIEEIDEEIVKLLADRFRIVKEIAETKKKLGLPVYDPEREEEIRKRWINLAEKYEVPRELVKNIVDAILNYSKIIQASGRIAEKWRNKIKILIVGSGNMGMTMYKMFKVFDIDVDIVSARKLCTEQLIDISCYNYVIFTTRPEYFASECFVKIVRNLREDAVVSDILSVKCPYFYHIEKELLSRNVHYISIHPLFGPLDIVVGETIVLIPSSRCPEDKFRLVQDLYKDVGLNVITLRSPEEHDYYMSIIQVAHHLHYLSLMRFFNRISRELNIDFKKLCTHSLRQTLQKLDRFKQLLNTILEIQIFNKYGREIRERARKEFDDLVSCLNSSKSVDDASICVG